MDNEEHMPPMEKDFEYSIDQIRRIAVLGAGTMGSRIAALVANAGCPVILLDMANGDDPDRSRIAVQALETLKKVTPPAFVDLSAASLVSVGNFEDDLDKLTDVDWVIEAVAEQIPIKQSLMAKILPYLPAKAILTTNTSGLRIAAIGDVLPEERRARFLGTHFFDPPRYMALLELIPTAHTSARAYETIAQFAEVHLGKTIVASNDTPNFIANRIGVFAVMNTMKLAREHGLRIEEVDFLTGSPLGWPKTGTFRLTDMVGVDVLVSVARNFVRSMSDERSDVETDPALEKMLELGLLGDKTKQGFYRRERDSEGRDQRFVLNLSTFEYEASQQTAFPGMAGTKISDTAATRIPALIETSTAGAKAGAFYWALLADLFTYAANRIGEVSDSIADIDLAMQAGFNWQLGPFALWDAAGVSNTVARMRREGRPVAPSVERLLLTGASSWYRDSGPEYFDLKTCEYSPVRVSPRVFSLARSKSKGIVKGSKDVSLIDIGDGVACIEVHSKMNTFGHKTVEFIRSTLEQGSAFTRQFEAFVISNEGIHFSTGANLAEAVSLIERKDWASMNKFIANFQAMTAAVKFCTRPVVAAPFGMCLGGGSELALHATSRQAHMETAMGLVETGVGLIPGGGGCKEMTLRALEEVAASGKQGLEASAEVSRAMSFVFNTIALAKVSSSAVEAKSLQLLRSSDGITMNRSLLLADAKAQARRLASAAYVPPVFRRDIPAPGQPALSSLEQTIYTSRQRGSISDHDVLVAMHAARTLCGGAIPSGTLLDEDHFIGLEREAFLSLCGEVKTQQRIVYTLKTGKPLRN